MPIESAAGAVERMTTKGLVGTRVLVLEDEPLVSMMIEDMLADLGAGAVRCAGNLTMAAEMIAARKPDLALLDVNVAGQPVFPVADALAAAQVPIIFLTGYGRGGFDGRWTDYNVIQKPFTFAALTEALKKVLAAGRTSTS